MTRRLSPLLALLFTAALLAAWSPATSNEPAPPDLEQQIHIDRRPGTAMLIPLGRQITPTGAQIEVPPHPYGLALSPDGKTLVASSNGTGPFALTVVSGADGAQPAVRTLAGGEGQPFRSLYRGVALSRDGRALYASGGNDGQIHVFRIQTEPGGAGLVHTSSISLDVDGHADSIPGDLSLSPDGRTLLALDQGNFRLAVIDTATGKVTASARTGRTPFSVAWSPDDSAAYVANIGLFEYRKIEGPAGQDARAAFPLAAYPSREAREGVSEGKRHAPGLGSARTPESYSVWRFDLADRNHPRAGFRVNTGIPVPPQMDADDPDDVPAKPGGSAPCAVLAGRDRLYVANSNNDSIQALDPRTGAVAGTILLSGLLPAPFRSLRGLTPYGMALSPDGKRLYAALSGFNAVAVIDAARLRPLGMIPTGWYPARVAVSPDGKRLYVANAKGWGAGPNGGKAHAAGTPTSVGALMHGSLSLLDVPEDAALRGLTRQVLANNNALAPAKPGWLPPVKHVLFITKENRTFDELFGAIPGVRGDAALARYGAPRPLAGISGTEPITVAPNHVALARRFGISDNFYVDSDHSADGHRWLVAAAPNHWTEGVTSAGYGGQMSQRTDTPAPGRRALFGANGSITPDEYPEAGTLWHHLARNRVSFYNWGDGTEFAGIDEGAGMKPTGIRIPFNQPMAGPLFRRTSRTYPSYNTYIPDQYRADVFLQDWEQFERGERALPRYMYLYLPNDHGAGPRPEDGYPSAYSYMADNDLALGRIMERLSRSRFWKDLVVVVTEDDAQGGVDSVDAHRSVLMVLSPWAKRGYVSRRMADLSAIHHAAFRLLHLPPLSLWDGLAGDLSDFWSHTPDLTPYTAVPIDRRLFDPAKARDPGDPKLSRLIRRGWAIPDDPDEVARLRRADGYE